MNHKINLMLLSLLGFGTGCSGSKEAMKGKNKMQERIDSLTEIRLMYGVPPVQYREQTEEVREVGNPASERDSVATGAGFEPEDVRSEAE